MMLEPSMISQERYDKARRGRDDTAVRLVEAMGRIGAASLGLASAAYAEALRDQGCPDANPLNEAPVSIFTPWPSKVSA